ncbi:MAG: hypothetical protein K8S23_06595 [Candidatus Cloacimonetes bacterium]|nr:hypothetical protein [Candidatus Cloacimonadota bacterium]
MSKKTNLFAVLTILLGMVFLIPTTVFATDIFRGTALNFDGVDDYVEIPDDTSLDFDTSYTLECWIYPGSFDYLAGLITKYHTAQGFTLRLSGSSPYSGIGFDDMETDTGILNAYHWYHIAAVNDNGTRHVYVNGIEKTLSGTPITFTPNNDPVCLGVDYLSSPRYFEGRMDEVRIWNVARTETQINDKMNTFLSGTETGLVSYYQLNEGSGITANDPISSNNGTLTNMTEDDWIPSSAPIGVGGTISTDTVWDAETINVISDITINDGVTLTINPGTTVYFQDYYALNVQGRILAEGTENDPINFTAHPVYHWQGIRFDYTPATNDSTKFKHCNFEYGEGIQNSWNEFNGGAIYTRLFSKILIDHCSFTNNYARYYGGAICLEMAHPTIANCTFDNNTAWKGGAIYGYYSSPDISKCVFENNQAEHIYNNGSGEGGAIYYYENGAMLVSQCLFSGNTAEDKGGAISYNNISLIRFQNCIFQENTSDNQGGAINCNVGTITLYNCTIVENAALNYGGAINIESTSNSEIYNCIIYDNTSAEGQINIMGTGGIQAIEYCNIEGGFAGITGAGSGASFNGIYEDCIDYDPGFTDAANDDYSLLSNSYCINGGDSYYNQNYNGEFDIAGNDRKFNSANGTGNLNDLLSRVDIGAYEYSAESGILPEYSSSLYYDGIVNYDLIILPDFTFTLNSSSNFEFDENAGLYIYGTLEASGSSYNNITFTASNESNGWDGLNFISTEGAGKSSNLEYCYIQFGQGNIYIENYDYLTLTGCTIENGIAENGGGIYSENCQLDMYDNILNNNHADLNGGGIYSNNCQLQMYSCDIDNNHADLNGAGFYSENSDLDIVNCIITNNQADQTGGGLYINNIETRMINLTIADNSAGTQAGAFEITNYSGNQPQIANCIIWNNGSNPIYPTAGSLTNVTYCDVENSYPGSNNQDFDPDFTDEVDDPYMISNHSSCLNRGIQDTTGYSLPDEDFAGNPRIHGHFEPIYDRIDMGAYEYEGTSAPYAFNASDGDNDFPGYVQLQWWYDFDYEPAPQSFWIARYPDILNQLDPGSFSYSDYTAIPGEVYEYMIVAMIDIENEFSASEPNSGYIKPNGIISGTVLSVNNNPVAGVKVSLDPSSGYCLEFDGSSDSLSIDDPEVNMDNDFTIECWFKTTGSDEIILSKGAHNFKVNASGQVEYTDGTNTIVQDSLLANDNEWHHLAVVNDVTGSRTLLYFDEYEVARDSSFTFSGSSSAGFATSDYTGFLDNIKIWTVARDSSDIVDGKDIVTAWDSPGLAGYWALNEGVGNTIFDATNYNHSGSIIGCDWSEFEPGVLMGAFTNEWGEYLISQINYGSSTTFSVIPYKSGHVFQPEQRQITLSESNIAQNDVDFTDNSLIPITGYVKFQGTECPVVGATIMLNGSPFVPITLVDEDGYYVIEVEHGTECIVSVEYQDHIFNRFWNLGEVTYPHTDKNFDDTFKTQFRCNVVGGDDSYPIGEFDVTIQSVNGCYYDEITGANWTTGGIMVPNLPPLDFNVTVDPAGDDPFNLEIDEQFQNLKTALISLTNTDEILDTLQFVWKADLEIEVTWSDTLVSYTFTEYPDNEFYVLQQNEWCAIEISAFEDYSYDAHPNQITYLDDCGLSIRDEVGTQGITETVFQDTTLTTYTFAPYLPNILSGYDRQYQNMMEITVEDTDLNRYATQTDWILTEGVKPLESTYATTSPEIPFLILHDPPGDGSFSSFGQSSSHSIAMSSAVCTDSELDMFAKIHLGPDVTTSIGIFYSVEVDVDVTMDLNMGFTLGTTQTRSQEQELTFTTSTEYSTSDDDQVIGAGSDLFVGGAMNLIWGVTNVISWDEIEQDVIVDTSVMVSPNGFATVYVYTDNQIRNTVIPNLEALGDTASVALWNTYLINNENNKASAVPNPNHPQNLSFNAGAGYSYEEETNTTISQTIEFETTVSNEFGFEIGATVNGVGGEFGFTYRTQMTIGSSSNSEFSTETETHFTLADDDETSDLNELADYFTLDVKVDPVYGTPVFDLVSGGSSCPWEPNTIPREGVALSANTYTASNLLSGEEAAFILTLGNTSQTSEDRRYYLTVLHGSNPGGAIVKINGVPLEERMAFDVIGGETVQAIMTVEQGPFAYEYDDLTLEFYSDCNRGKDGPDGHYFDMFKSFDIYWEAPYSRISINSPEDDWIINKVNDDTLDILLTDYDLTKPDFQSIKLQYKHPQDENWFPAFEIFRDSLLSHPHYIEVSWDVSGISDGFYEIRAATTDSVQADYFTESLSGVIDRTSPELLVDPFPQDEILEPEDEIALIFMEAIDPLSVNPANFSLIITRNGMSIGHDITYFENAVYLNPNIANFWFENETLEAEVSGLKDLYGNEMEVPISWEFYVNSNPVNWNVTKLDVIKPLGETMTLTANLINDGGQHYSYVFTDYADSLYHPELQYHAPDWLSITPTSGQLIPLDSQEISFEISDQIGFGHYETIIYAHTSMGNEAIEIEVDVLSNPPDWSITEFNNFQSSMSIIGELDFEGELSTDTNDIIGAFIQEESEDWVCRGVANIESVPYILGHPYQIFLTIYSDLDDPVRNLGTGKNSRTEDEIRFRVWDNSENKEYYQVDHTVFGGTLMYLANEVYGTPLNPISMTTVADMVQDIPLASGWTWFSTNLDIVPNIINDVLGSLNPVDEDYIKAQTQYAQYLTDSWYGTLTSLSNTAMYKIKMAEAQNLEIIGELRDPFEITISYSTGWNWISYIPHVSMSVNAALSDRTNIAGDFIKNQAGYAFYVDSDIGWIGSLRFMNPDEGFMLYSSGTGSFEYPEYNIRGKDDFPDLTPLVLRDAPDWSFNPQDFEYTASVTIELQINAIPATSGNYMVGAFVGEDCRGSVTSIPVFDTYMYFLTVFSNTQNEDISLKIYDADADEIIDPAHSFTFNNDLILGSPSTPYELEIAGALDIPQNIIIEIIGSEVQLSWDEVAGANSYKIFASDDPNGDFTDATASGTFDNNRWTAIATEERRFYYVTASTDIVVRNSVIKQGLRNERNRFNNRK